MTTDYYVWLENQGKEPHPSGPYYCPIRNPISDGIDTVAIYEEARQERIAAERFDEHEGSDMQITVKRLDSGYYHIRGNGPCNWCQVPRWPASRQEIKDGMFPEAGADFVRDVIREAERVIEEAELLKGSDDESQDNRDEDRV